MFNTTFDVFAENYHSVRPGYPPELFGDIQGLCDVGHASRLLEIGAGSGIATAQLARFGAHVVAIEPGEHLAALAREQMAGFRNVEVQENAFEDFDAQEQFDAVLAFTAYHWIDEGIKYQKVLDLLRKNGDLVLVWNSFFLSNTKVTEEVNAAFHHHLPDEYPRGSTVPEVNEMVLSKLHRREQEIVVNESFYTTTLRKYYAVYNYNATTYPKFLNTFPKIAEVESGRKERFLNRIGDIVDAFGSISVPVLTTLLICKKRSGFLEIMSRPEKEPESANNN